MPIANFEFSPELAVLLSAARSHGRFAIRFAGPQTVKHLIETLRVPHTEVHQVLSAGREIPFTYLVQDHDAFMVRGIIAERTETEPSFVLDCHLGRLAASLRMLGMDCAYDDQIQDMDLVRIALAQNRILVSRDRRLLMRKIIQRGYLVRSKASDEQLFELCRRFGLTRWFRPFQRCIRCNALLQATLKEAVLHRLLPLTRLYYEEFRICPNCLQPYWEGSHVGAMQEKIQRLEYRLEDARAQEARAIRETESHLPGLV